VSIGTDTPLVTTWHEVWRDYWDDYLGRLALGGKAVEHLTARLPQHPTAVSGVTADRLSAIGPSRDDIEVIPNGIDIDRIQNAAMPEVRADGGLGGPFDILFAGRLIQDKRVDLLLDAFDTIAAEYDITLGIIGEGPELDRLRMHATELDNADRVSFLGFLEEYDDVLAQMRAARVFASPSTREGFGITYAEAMAADCAVVGANHPESAASEVIGDAGYLPDPNVTAITTALERALTEKTPSTAPTKRAQRFDWDTVAAQASSVYETVVAEH
jgi:glycosyltransferase involved in cell wall biosynthesis